MMSVASFSYRLYGLTVRSDRPIALLRPERREGRDADLSIVFAPVRAPAGTPVFRHGGLDLYPENRATFGTETGLRFLMEAGTRIVAQVPAEYPAAGLHAALFGPVMGWVLHQRGLMPLHGCGIGIGDRAVALVGHSGAGKSTLGRALIARGHHLLTDDQMVIDPQTLRVEPGFPGLKLWSDAADWGGDEPAPGDRIRDGHDKFQIRLPDAFRAEPAPLALIVSIGFNPNVAVPVFQQLERSQAAAMLNLHIYQVAPSRRDGRAIGQFLWATAIASRVPVLALDRPDRKDLLAGICETIERRVAAVPDGARPPGPGSAS